MPITQLGTKANKDNNHLLSVIEFYGTKKNCPRTGTISLKQLLYFLFDLTKSARLFRVARTFRLVSSDSILTL